MATEPMTPEQPTQPGYEICIKISGDGSISVYSEPEGAEQPEMGMEAAEPASLPAGTIEEALEIAKQIHAGNGQMPKAEGMTVEDAFSQGFKGTEV